LPDLNLGTAGGASCSPGLRQRLGDVLAAQHGYGFVIDGRFKGGYITRHYGNPGAGIDAVQLELTQSTYMDERTFEYLPARAARLQVLLAQLLKAAVG
ncbi:MAG TPA: N-formylglutamate amidohydrolase, partial [Pseudoxanthomonas sp.]|nr:N-formylglutamate amidohydrolase [Pseudoxanthomonas sp.]